jgi:predicted ATP-grasp superfamily ATP-dependent carboligase
VQLEIVNSADSAEAKTWETTATTVHERAANRAERAGHSVACADGLAGRVGSELVFTADVY